LFKIDISDLGLSIPHPVQAGELPFRLELKNFEIGVARKPIIPNFILHLY
jgi:hypothetical protein